MAEKIHWKEDAAHSEITFKVRHMMITNVTGLLRDYSIHVISDDENFTNAQVEFTGKTASITTGNEQRDAHLSGGDFFDAEKNPEIKFKSTSYTSRGGNDYMLKGDLTIKGETKPIELFVEYHGMNKDPWGNRKAGFSVSGKINRKDFGLTWNMALETGGVLVSDEVKFHCEIQLIEDKK